ncbi:hydroxyisourate hydrolase [Metabacillus fastidiosus]|uniref:hydroxyisourate hydrolase n=1 Tax=Metabacillus fastidiosus TaxID=1458 RepID=UPI002DBCFD4A|nr:hydroxyisourate hydrolase [Metabacillus fastidiosus]MEC2078677.1 hydroxyisourate hydrolase [Metabacillus fastidiosus]
MSLTTHVLDLSKGLPAKEVKIDLWRLNSDNRELLKTVHTNSDGRVDSPLLTREETEVGQYELVFYVGEYLANGGKAEENAFLNEVPIRFGISNPESHYHIPLLVAPGGYSTYRGS